MVITPYLWPLLTAATVLAGLGFYARRHRDVPAAVPFSAVAFLIAGWALVYALDDSTSDLAAKVFFTRGRYVFAAGLPAAILVFVAHLTGRDGWFTRRRIGLLLVVPAITVLLAFTSDHQSLFRYAYQLDTAGPVPVLLYQNGPWTWVYLAYGYAVDVTSFSLLLVSMGGASALHFRRGIAIAVALVFPEVVDLLFQVGVTPVRGYNFTPSAFLVTGLIYAWVIFRYRMLDVVPIARNATVDSLPDLFLVLDSHWRLSDANAAAQQALGFDAERSVGLPIEQCLSRWPEIVAACRDETSDSNELVIGEGPTKRFYTCLKTRAHDASGNAAGYLVLLRDFTERKRNETALRALHDATSALASTLDLDAVFERIFDSVARVVPYDAACVFLVEQGAATMVHSRGYAERGIDLAELLRQLPIPSAPNLRKMIQTGRPLTIADTRADPEWIQAASCDWLRAYAGTPIRLHDQVIGFLNLDSATVGAFTSEHVDLLSAFADQAAVAIENARLYARQRAIASENAQLYAAAQQEISRRQAVEESLREANRQLQARLAEIVALQEQLREQAIRDALTGLFNRRYLEETLARELARVEREGSSLGIVMIDVDHFKLTNDAYGHDAGDLVLQALSHLLTAETRRGDIVCRYGGEEFVVVLPGATAGQLLERVEVWRVKFQALRTEYEGATLSTTFSAGVAAYPQDGFTPDALVRAADRALYAAKLSGRNRTALADESFSPLTTPSLPVRYD